MSTPLTIGQDSVMVSWKAGKLLAPGYDLESERIALILAGGYGQGIGVALLAIEECIKVGSPLGQIIQHFEESLRLMESEPDFFHDGSYMKARQGGLQERPQQEILFCTYLSFSPDDEKRVWAAENGKLGSKSWTRLLQDKNEIVFALALGFASEPKEELIKYVTHPNHHYRAHIALNENLSFGSKLKLANDDNYAVRRALLGSDIPQVLRTIIKAHNDHEDAQNQIKNAQLLEERAAKAIQLAKKSLIERKPSKKDIGI